MTIQLFVKPTSIRYCDIGFYTTEISFTEDTPVFATTVDFASCARHTKEFKELIASGTNFIITIEAMPKAEK